jgi:hypothetical protein
LSGDTLLVGAMIRNTVYVFTRSDAAWSQQTKLTASDGTPADAFGVSVALSGNTAVVGANMKDNIAGAAYVFTCSGATWSQQTKLTASDTAPGDTFGFKVDVSANTVLVGADYKNVQTGAAYIYYDSFAPAVSTSPSGSVTTTSAVLNGSLVALGNATSVKISFEYGQTTTYGSTTPVDTMSATGPFSASVTGLYSGTTYHFRAKADGGNTGVAYGVDVTFTTGSSPACTVPPQTVTATVTVTTTATKTVTATGEPQSTTSGTTTTGPVATTSSPSLIPSLSTIPKGVVIGVIGGGLLIGALSMFILGRRSARH